MQLFFLVIGTLLTLTFFIFLIKGKKYHIMLEGLDNNDFPFYALYTAGFALNDSRLFQLKGRQAGKLYADASLLYGEKFKQYYAHLVWAQTLTLVLLAMTVVALISGIVEGSALFLIIMVFVGVFCFHFFYDNMGRKLAVRRQACAKELPNMISKLALLTNSGMSLRKAWFVVAESKEGVIYDFMKEACDDIRNGMSDIDAIYRFGVISGSPEVKKFSSAIIQSLEKGGGADLVYFLSSQSSEMWALKKQELLQEGEKAAGKLVAPIGLMFAGVLIIVLSAALSGGLGI